MSADDKHGALRERIREIFHRFRATRGYRLIWAVLRQGEDPVRVSEKVVRRIMAEEGLVVVYNKKKRSYSLYAGEMGDAPENLVLRDFHAGAPNRLWLTNITEFRLDAGKVYLSPVLDCFDGKLVSWSVGTRPTGELANSSLRGACGALSEGERPADTAEATTAGRDGSRSAPSTGSSAPCRRRAARRTTRPARGSSAGSRTSSSTTGTGRESR